MSSSDENSVQADATADNSSENSSDTVQINVAIMVVHNRQQHSETETTSEQPIITGGALPSTPQDDEQTTVNIRRESQQHPREWNTDEVLGWFHSYNLDELYVHLFPPNEDKDGAALASIFDLKLKNYDLYKAQYTRDLRSNQNNLLRDFNRFGQLLDTYFIDKYAHRFDVAFSFPGEIRDKVSRIAEKLCTKINKREGEQRLFYDKYHQAELARPNLDLYLQTIYRYQTRLIVVFMCNNYKLKEWCGLEARAIRGLLKANQNDRIMLLKIDGTIIDGFLDIDGYLNISNKTDDNVADKIYSRLVALGKPLPPSSVRIESEINMVWRNIYNPLLLWFIVVGLISYMLGTLIGR